MPRNAHAVAIDDRSKLAHAMVTLGPKILEQVSELCAGCGVARLDLTGSAARDDFDPSTSDIDLLVEFLPLQPIELADAYFGLEHQLTEKLDSPVDLVMADAVRNPIVRDHIEAAKRLIYEA